MLFVWSCFSITALADQWTRRSQAKADSATPTLQAARKLIPKDLALADMKASGKMLALADLLSQLKSKTEEKIVIVSNFTSVRFPSLHSELM